MKLFYFSGKSLLDDSADFVEFKNKFQVTANGTSPNLFAAEQVLQNNFDVIELGPGDFKLFKPYLKSLDVKTSRLGVADCLIRVGSSFRPLQILSEAVYAAILNKKSDLKTSESAVVIGDFDFVLSMTYKLAQVGFFKIIIATEKPSESIQIKKLIQTYAFNIQISTVALTELTQLESSSILLISNLHKKINPEAYESIAYFNFLSRGAVFIDINSRNEPVLVEEARRAEINVIEEIEILRIKYHSILEMLKNSPFV